MSDLMMSAKWNMVLYFSVFEGAMHKESVLSYLANSEIIWRRFSMYPAVALIDFNK